MASFSKIVLVAALTLPVLVSCGKSDTPADTVQNQPVPQVDGAVKATLDENTAKIEAVKDLAGLATVNPSIMQDPKKDAPKFVEYKKKQMLLGIATSRVRTTEYLELDKQLLEIVEYRDKWSKELKDADAKMQALLADQKSGTNEDFTKAIQKRMSLLLAHQATPEYQAHMKATQTKRDMLTKQLSRFTTPEIQKLQEEVIALRKEVYGK